MAQLVKNPPTMQETTCNVRNLGLIPGSGRFLGEGNGNPLHILAWEIPWTEEPEGHILWGRKELETTSCQNNNKQRTVYDNPGGGERQGSHSCRIKI